MPVSSIWDPGGGEVIAMRIGGSGDADAARVFDGSRRIGRTAIGEHRSVTGPFDRQVP